MLPWLKVSSISCTSFGIFHSAVSVLVPDFILKVSNKWRSPAFCDNSTYVWSKTMWCVFVDISLMLWMEAWFLFLLNIRHWTSLSARRWDSLIMLCVVHMGQTCYECTCCQIAIKTFHVVCPSLCSKNYFCLPNNQNLRQFPLYLNSIVCGILFMHLWLECN
jgi:hypothetical protein